MARSKFKLIQNNWNSLNDLMNDSPELQKMLNKAAGDIYQDTLAALDAIDSPKAGWVKENAEFTIAAPTEDNKLIMRFISIPGVGFEMRYSPLGSSLKNE